MPRVTKRPANGSKFKEDDSALPLLELLFYSVYVQFYWLQFCLGGCTSFPVLIFLTLPLDAVYVQGWQLTQAKIGENQTIDPAEVSNLLRDFQVHQPSLCLSSLNHGHSKVVFVWVVYISINLKNCWPFLFKKNSFDCRHTIKNKFYVSIPQDTRSYNGVTFRVTMKGIKKILN